MVVYSRGIIQMSGQNFVVTKIQTFSQIIKSLNKLGILKNMKHISRLYSSFFNDQHSISLYKVAMCFKKVDWDFDVSITLYIHALYSFYAVLVCCAVRLVGSFFCNPDFQIWRRWLRGTSTKMQIRCTKSLFPNL